MRQVILQIDLTLDGFIADSNGEINWVKPDPEMNQDANALLSAADTILLGRVAYQDFVTYWPFADTTASSTESQIASKINHANKVVFSKTLDTVEWGAWNNARLVKTDIAEEITNMKAQSGKNLILYAGAAIISTFMQLDLVDEYLFRVHPVVLGSGKSFFRNLHDKIDLKLVKTKVYQHGVVLFDYKPDNH